MAEIKRRIVDMGELFKERTIYEELYGVPSSDLISAFVVNGQLQETDDFRRWSHIHRMLEKYAPKRG